MNRGEVHAVSPLTKDLLAIDCYWGKSIWFGQVCCPQEVVHASVDGPTPMPIKAVLRGL